MSEEAINEVQKLVWNYQENISAEEKSRRLNAIREFLKTRNLHPMNLTRVFKGKCEETHLSAVDIVSKLAVASFRKN